MTDEHGRFITREEAESIATTAAEKAVRSTFAILGVDLNEFESVQDFRGDLQWLKSGRRISRAAGGKAGTSIIGVIGVGLAIGVYDFFKNIITISLPH